MSRDLNDETEIRGKKFLGRQIICVKNFNLWNYTVSSTQCKKNHNMNIWLG